jgi:hypothetical protein
MTAPTVVALKKGGAGRDGIEDCDDEQWSVLREC